MKASPSVLLLDDGELDEVVNLLEDLGADFQRIRGGALEGVAPAARNLVIATSRRAIAHLEPPAVDDDCADPAKQPVRVAVVREDSRQLRTQLRLLGFDFLVRLPVHTEALRLLLLRALFQGPDRRRSARLPVGVDTRMGNGKRSHDVTLCEISRYGCQVISPFEEPVGMGIELDLPAEITGQGPVALSGRVVRQSAKPNDSEDPLYAIAVEFGALDESAKECLEHMLQLYGGESTQENGKPDLEEEEPEFERRSLRRTPFGREIMAFSHAAHRTLIGKDVSLGGMRIEPRPGLVPGETLRLAFFGSCYDEPFTISARVTRNDGAQGVAVQFDPMPPEVEVQLEQLITGLPPIESLQDGESESLGAVLTEILSP